MRHFYKMPLLFILKSNSHVYLHLLAGSGEGEEEELRVLQGEL